MKGLCRIAAIALISVLSAACMTTGYSYAKDPKVVGKWDVTITKIEPQNIYNSLGVVLVGPFASVESHGQRITFITTDGKSQTIVQPLTDRYELHEGQHARYIADRGQVWVQPTEYPLPPEFGQGGSATPPLSKVHIQLPQGYAVKPLTEQMKAAGGIVYAVNATTGTAVVLEAIPRRAITDLTAFAASRQSVLVDAMNGATQSSVTPAQIPGKSAVRFEVTGTLKSGNGANIVVIGTVIAGDTEVAFLRVWTNAAGYMSQRDTMEELSKQIVGL